MFNKIRQWISIKKHQNARLLLLFGIIGFNVLLWFFSSIIAFVISPGSYVDVIEALWSSGITWMLEPGFYDPSMDVPIRVISIIVIITSMITFSGGIIGYVASLFSSIIENSKQGKGKLFVYDHILILNWNTKALELIADYRYDDATTNVVILSNCDKNEVEEAVKRKLYDVDNQRNNKKINVIIREGDVFSKSDLMDVCIEMARTIIILSDEEGVEAIEGKHVDIQVIKTLMLVANLNIKPVQTIIVEVKQEKTVEIIKDKIELNLGFKNQIFPILPDELMGRLIAQTILMPDLNKVYEELFSFEGAEFYTMEETNGDQYAQTHNRAIPIYNLKGQLYLMAACESDLYAEREEPLMHYKKLTMNTETRYQDRTIVIFGKNNKLRFILDSIRLFERENNTKVDVVLVESNEADVIEKRIKTISKIDTILILSTDYLEPRKFDSDVLVTLLMIQEIAKTHQAEIVIELLNPRHFDIAQSYNIRNTIISNKYVSRLITQISKNRYLYALYEDLLTYDPEESTEQTFEVYSYLAKDIFMNEFPLKFSSRADFVYSCYKSGEGDYIMIGIIRNGEMELFKGNLDEAYEFEVLPYDSIITICK